MKHEQAYELMESYVFGTLDHDERVAVESHLDSGCKHCLERLRETGELSARLATAVPQSDPSPQLKQNILDSIRSESGRATAKQRRRAPVFGWVSAFAGAAAVIVLLVWTMDLKQQMNELRSDLTSSQDQIARMEHDLATYTDAALLLGMPCTKLAKLGGVDPNPQAFGQVILHPEESFGVVYVYRMPQAPEGMEYQLWMLRDGKPTSVGVFAVLEDGSAILKMEALPDPKSIEEFAVTIEPHGGQPQPTGMMYLTGPNPLGSSP